MPNFERGEAPADDLDIAAKVMDTVQKQIASYQQALQTLRTMRKELADRDKQESSSGQPRRNINTPALLAELFEKHGIPQPLSRAMAAEDFQDAAFEAEAAFWTWDCCCTACCLTCQMATVVTKCSETFVW